MKPTDTIRIPVFDRSVMAWFLLDGDGERVEILEADALELVAMAGGIKGDGTIF